MDEVGIVLSVLAVILGLQIVLMLLRDDNWNKLMEALSIIVRPSQWQWRRRRQQSSGGLSSMEQEETLMQPYSRLIEPEEELPDGRFLQSTGGNRKTVPASDHEAAVAQAMLTMYFI